MNRRIVLLAAAFLMTPLAAFAHGVPPAPAHGGIVAEGSGEHWVEMSIVGDQLTAWVSDEDNKPIPSAQLSGKATVLIDGKTQAVPLSPADGNSITGTLAAPATGRMAAVLALMAQGKPVQVKFVAP